MLVPSRGAQAQPPPMKAYILADPRSQTDAPSASVNAGDKRAESDIPVPYRKPHMKLSRLGISDFDFSSFNKSPHCGLEDCGPNSFCNALLQARSHSVVMVMVLVMAMAVVGVVMVAPRRDGGDDYGENSPPSTVGVGRHTVVLRPTSTSLLAPRCCTLSIASAVSYLRTCAPTLDA